MAYYSRTGYGGRRSYGSYGRYSSKSGRASTKNATSSRVKRMVEDTMDRKINGPRKVNYKGNPSAHKLYAGGPMGEARYFRVPVTQIIPQQPAQSAAPGGTTSVSGRRYRVTGVCIRFELELSTSMEVMGLCYPARVQVAPIPVDGDQFSVGTQLPEQGNAFRLMSMQETNFLNGSGEGPLAVVRRAGEKEMYELDSTDGGLFKCRLSTGVGKPVGKAVWKVDSDRKKETGRTYRQEFHMSGLSRTANWGKNEPGAYVQHDRRDVEVFWDLGKTPHATFRVHPNGSVVMENPLELMMGVRATGVSAAAEGLDAVASVECGRLSNVKVDVYYS